MIEHIRRWRRRRAAEKALDVLFTLIPDDADKPVWFVHAEAHLWDAAGEPVLASMLKATALAHELNRLYPRRPRRTPQGTDPLWN